MFNIDLVVVYSFQTGSRGEPTTLKLLPSLFTASGVAKIPFVTSKLTPTMKSFLPPLCLLLALISIIGAFILLSQDPPEAKMELHKARVEGNEDLRQGLEQDLERQKSVRKILIVGLFASGALFICSAFVTMEKKTGWNTKGDEK